MSASLIIIVGSWIVLASLTALAYVFNRGRGDE